jgi:hypothetical protein
MLPQPQQAFSSMQAEHALVVAKSTEHFPSLEEWTLLWQISHLTTSGLLSSHRQHGFEDEDEDEDDGADGEDADEDDGADGDEDEHDMLFCC